MSEYLSYQRTDGAPTKSIPGTEITYTSDYYTPQHYNIYKGVVENCKIKAVISSSDGNMVVHLVDDYESSGAKRYCTLKLLADVPRYAIFDEIKETGTTVTETNCTLYPL